MKIFLQKTFLQIFLHKSLTRVFLQRFSLLVVLFLSGCSVADMLYVVSGRTGTYYIDDDTYTFTISDDGQYYTDINDNFTLKYKSSSDDFVEYGLWVDNTYITVALTDIGEFGGDFNEYIFYENTGETKMTLVGFSWIIDYSD